MSEITDQTLSAYMDHALDEARRAQVEAALARDPALARRLDALRNADAMAREALSAISATPVPEPLTRAASARRRAEATVGHRRLRMPSWLLPSGPLPALAAGVVAGIALSLLLPLSQLLQTGGQDTPPGAQPMHIPTAVATALSSTPSGAVYTADGTAVAPLSTYRLASGRICREYQVRIAQGQPLAGVACRSGGGGWTSEAMVSLGGGGAYTPATSGAGLKAMRPAWRDAETLSDSEERALLERWSGQTG